MWKSLSAGNWNFNLSFNWALPMGPKPPPFAKLEYWDERFKDNPDAYDWLQQPPVLDAAITDALLESDEASPRILHIGCGTSLLSFHLRKHVKDPRQIQNLDFSAEAVAWGRKKEIELFGYEVDRDEDAAELVDNFEQPETSLALAMPATTWTQTSLLSLESVISTCSLGAYQVIVDKSLCDAIACGSDVEVSLPYFLYMNLDDSSAEDNSNIDFTEGRDYNIHPLHVLAIHLALTAASPGARWIALSYAEHRFPFLNSPDHQPRVSMGEVDFSLPRDMIKAGFPDPAMLWRLISKEAVASTYGGSTRGADGVHRPASYHWLYVLERTHIELKVRGT